MNLKRTSVAIALMTIAAWGGACSSTPIAQPAPEEAQAPVTATKEATALPLSSAGNGEEVATPMAGLTGTPAMVATPILTPEAISPEEDCMAECHIPDPNELFGAAAKPLPASHAGRTTCLTCHTTADAPALPDTHVGRLDESCLGCHK